MHDTLHPELLVGPTVAYHTRIPGLTVGANADFVYAVGFDYGASVTGFAKYTLRQAGRRVSTGPGI